MDIFTSTYVNKVDKKGRVSVPAPFRSTLAKDQSGTQTEVIIFPSLYTPSLEACTPSYISQLSKSLDDPDTDEEKRELLETAIFGRLVQCTLDPEGRIILPDHLLEYAGITENISFFGKRKTFQLWEPSALAEHERAAREAARKSNISIATLVARAGAKEA